MQSDVLIEKYGQYIESLDILPASPRILARVWESISQGGFQGMDLARLVQLDVSLLLPILKEIQFNTEKLQTLPINPDRVQLEKISCIAILKHQQVKAKNDPLLDHPFIDTYFLHSILCGCLAQNIAEQISHSDTTLCYLAGLYHDIGKWLMFSWRSDLYSQCLELSEFTDYPVSMFELEKFGFDHTHAGQWALKHWAFPVELVSVAGNHHPKGQPNRNHSFEPLLSIVVFTDKYVNHYLKNGRLNELDVSRILHDSEDASLFSQLDFNEINGLLEYKSREYKGDSPKSENMEGVRRDYSFAEKKPGLLDSESFGRPAGPEPKTCVRILKNLVDAFESAAPYKKKISNLVEQLNWNPLFKKATLVQIIPDEKVLSVYYPNKDHCIVEKSCFDASFRIKTMTSPFLAFGRMYQLLVTEDNADACLLKILENPIIQTEPVYLSNKLIGIIAYIRHNNLQQKHLESDEDIAVCIKLFKSLFKNCFCNEFSVRPSNQFNPNLKRIRDSDENESIAQKMQSIGRLAGGIGHEINNPLMVIELCLHKLFSQVDNPEINKTLDLIQQNTNRITKIVQNLMHLVGPSGIKPGNHNIINAIENTLKSVENRLVSSDIKIEVTLPEHPVYFFGDLHILQQAILNLLLNSIEAIEANEGGGTIQVIGKHITVSKEFMLQIIDNGKGIEKKDLDVIFEPFYTTKKFSKGIGLGLITSKSILEKHGGNLTIESEPEKGTRVKAVLPALSGVESESEIVLPEKPEPLGKKDLSLKLENPSILIIDDEKDIVEIISEIFLGKGNKIVTEKNGSNAIKLLEKQHFDIAFIDYKIPGKNGIQVARYILENDINTKIVFISGETNEDEFIEFLGKHDIPFIEKPFRIEDLMLYI